MKARFSNAMTVASAPTKAIAYPRNKPGRRPRRAMTAERVRPATAPPRVTAALADPAKVSAPSIDFAARPPTVTATEFPAEPRVWLTMSTRSVRRWIASRAPCSAFIVVAELLDTVGDATSAIAGESVALPPWATREVERLVRSDPPVALQPWGAGEVEQHP